MLNSISNKKELFITKICKSKNTMKKSDNWIIIESNETKVFSFGRNKKYKKKFHSVNGFKIKKKKCNEVKLTFKKNKTKQKIYQILQMGVDE